MQGKQAIVTGATNGIGEITALELARAGAGVTIVSRNEEKCRAVVDRIRAATQNEHVEYIVADLSSIEAARAAAARYAAAHDRLDVLVNNAGAVFSKRLESVDGIEMSVALNHVGVFVFTNALLELLKSTAAAHPEWGARVVTVSSGAHRSGMHWQDIQWQKSYSGFRAYGQSKAMNILFSNALARRLEGSGVTSNALHPGVVRTGFGQEHGGWLKPFLPLIGWFSLSPEQGAETSIYLATSDAVAGVTGKYFEKSRPAQPIAEMNDPAAQDRLWALTEEWVANAG